MQFYMIPLRGFPTVMQLVWTKIKMPNGIFISKKTNGHSHKKKNKTFERLCTKISENVTYFIIYYFVRKLQQKLNGMMQPLIIQWWIPKIFQGVKVVGPKFVPFPPKTVRVEYPKMAKNYF